MRCSFVTIDKIGELKELLQALQEKNELLAIEIDGKKCYSLVGDKLPVDFYIHIYGEVTEIKRGVPKTTIMQKPRQMENGSQPKRLPSKSLDSIEDRNEHPTT